MLFRRVLYFFFALLVAASISLTNSGIAADKLKFAKEELRIAFVGGSLAERMNLYGHFETLLHTAFPEKRLVIRNFGWPADEVGLQQRPDNYSKIDHPFEVFSPELLFCFFGLNESFAGSDGKQLEQFRDQYRAYLKKQTELFTKDGQPPQFVLVSPIAFEATGNPLQPTGEAENRNLEAYAATIERLATELQVPYVDLFAPTKDLFSKEVGPQFTINGIHLNEAGDREVAWLLYKSLFTSPHPVGLRSSVSERVRQWVNDKSWFHLQDYRMLNGWYVYGGRRTWDTETFPLEFQKIRKMVAVRDRYVWDLANGRQVPEKPDDSQTGELFVPETMFGTRDEKFRSGREPPTLQYPTPEASIQQMKVPEGFEVQLVASEREFPELANPTQLAFDNRGRLWVSCMINYPQWLPGAAKPGDKLLIFEDDNDDGRADRCKTFYDKLICPTGFEFYRDGVLVVDEPRILFLRDTDGDDRADEVTHLIDGIATDDTHHTMGAFEWSHGGELYMLEGISMSTTLETPWGPFRRQGASGGYIFDPQSFKFRHFKTPGYGNPWCMVFDSWGNGIVGDGTNAQQHWTSPLAGAEVASRRTLNPIFDNQSMRPACGNEFLRTRQFPDSVQGQFVYGCVINMHGLPRFTVTDEEGGAGFQGKRVEDLLTSTDMFFRPVDPQIGPDGALWFADWCNALIGHMQYSQRDPNRDHEHGRVYRLVYTKKPLLEKVTQSEKPIPELLDQLKAYEPRTRYRARRELERRGKEAVLPAVKKWIAGVSDPQQLCEALWIQERLRSVDPELLQMILKSDDFHARSAALTTLINERVRVPDAFALIKSAVVDPHPRVRLEAVKGLSFFGTIDAAEAALQVVELPTDYWIDYTLEHTLHALASAWTPAHREEKFLASASEKVKEYFAKYLAQSLPGGQVIAPLKIAENGELPEAQRLKAVEQLAKIRGGKASNGKEVFNRVCAACHQIGDVGKEFGPKLHDIGLRMNRQQLIRSILWPNESIAKGFETISVLTHEGITINGFVLQETNETISLGTANGKVVEVSKEEIELRKEMKASSMPEGLLKTVAPIEVLDLLEYLGSQKNLSIVKDPEGWIATGAGQIGELRERGGFREVSRDAELKIGDRWPEHWNQQANLLLSALDPDSREFAFHSPDEIGTSSPSITIRLAKDTEVRHVWIENRTNASFYNRAQGITLWLSDDGQQWTRMWTAATMQPEWDVQLPAGTKARFIKIGLDGKGIFHLNRVAVFGNPITP